MSKELLVSIITPVFNSAQYLSVSIESVMSQDYQNWELFLIDDCSADNSKEIIQEHAAKDKRIKAVFLEHNRGSGVARNIGIEKAAGQFIAFLDSDDIWDSKKLSIQINTMLKNGWNFSHSSFGYINAKGSILPKKFIVENRSVDYYFLLKNTQIGCLTAIYNCGEIGKFYMSEHRRKQDYALWLSILKSGHPSHPISDVLAFYRIRTDSATSKKHKLVWKHVRFLHDTQKMNWFKAVYYTLHWMINGIKRHFINR